VAQAGGGPGLDGRALEPRRFFEDSLVDSLGSPEHIRRHACRAGFVGEEGPDEEVWVRAPCCLAGN